MQIITNESKTEATSHPVSVRASTNHLGQPIYFVDYISPVEPTVMPGVVDGYQLSLLEALDLAEGKSLTITTPGDSGEEKIIIWRQTKEKILRLHGDDTLFETELCATGIIYDESEEISGYKCEQYIFMAEHEFEDFSICLTPKDCWRLLRLGQLREGDYFIRHIQPKDTAATSEPIIAVLEGHAVTS